MIFVGRRGQNSRRRDDHLNRRLSAANSAWMDVLACRRPARRRGGETERGRRDSVSETSIVSKLQTVS